MSDANPPRLTECTGFPGIHGCHNYIPVDLEGRSAHRRWHIHTHKVTEALREANKVLQAQVRELTTTVARIQQDVEGIEIPEPVAPFSIVTADDLEPLPDDDEPQVSQYAGSSDETALAAISRPTISEPSDGSYFMPAIDRPDEPLPTDPNATVPYRPGFMQ